MKQILCGANLMKLYLLITNYIHILTNHQHDGEMDLPPGTELADGKTATANRG